MKESPRRPCLGWWRVKNWTERWPARGPYAVGENRLCLLTRDPLAAKGRTIEGESPTRPPTARPKKNYDGLFLHTNLEGWVWQIWVRRACLRRADTLLRSGLTNLSEIEPQMALCGHWTRHRAPHGACGVFGGSQSQVSGPAQLFDCLWSQTSPFIYLLEHIRLVGLEDGHRMAGHACLTGRDVGLSDKSRSGPTWLSWKEGTRLPRRRQRGWKMGG